MCVSSSPLELELELWVSTQCVSLRWRPRIAPIVSQYIENMGLKELKFPCLLMCYLVYLIRKVTEEIFEEMWKWHVDYEGQLYQIFQKDARIVVSRLRGSSLE